MFVQFGADNTSVIDAATKVEATNNIITLVRASQANAVPVDYDGLIAEAEAKKGAFDPEVQEIKTLLYALRDTNPY